jgi:hypothetical protein
VDEATLMRKFHGFSDLARDRQLLFHRDWPLRQERKTPANPMVPRSLSQERIVHLPGVSR